MNVSARTLNKYLDGMSFNIKEFEKDYDFLQISEFIGFSDKGKPRMYQYLIPWSKVIQELSKNNTRYHITSIAKQNTFRKLPRIFIENYKTTKVTYK